MKHPDTIGLDDALIVPPADWSYVVNFIRSVCNIAGDAHFVEHMHDELLDRGIFDAVRQHDTPKIFEWFVEAASFQGIADQVARGYIAQHGSAKWDVVRRALVRKPRCFKLERYWTYHACQYRKEAQSCANPAGFAQCGVPALPCRNGSLSQMAASLFLFMRDIAGGDFIGWLTQQLQTPPDISDADTSAAARKAVVAPLRSVHGLSDKVLNMTLASLLLTANHRQWRAVGASMVAVDTLVHNFLQRSGILKRCATRHLYGSGCYAEGGCADLLYALAAEVDARAYNRSFPQYFPRFVQHAIWRFCSKDGVDCCNGNRVDDRASRQNDLCRLYRRCDKELLRPNVI